MSISGAMNNAMSGLRAASRASELISSNIANALTPGYGQRSLALSANTLGASGGVKIDGVTRRVDESILSDRRLASAEQSDAQSIAGFFTKVESLLGTPETGDALASRINGFESSLISAASNPNAPERLTNAVTAARDLALHLNKAAEGIQSARSAADREIGQQVDQLNTELQQVRQLNHDIQTAEIKGYETAALKDQRQQIMDQIGGKVAIRSVPRDNGQVAIYTLGGAILLDGSAAELSFQPVNLVTAHHSVANGTLSGLSINDIPVRTDAENGALKGGSLSALFAIRDDHGVTAQTQLDAVARDLIERFQDPAVDPTLGVGDAGLFTNNNAAFVPADEVGLAARITINSAVDPDQGGAAWRMRDGIGATTQGNVGDASQLNTLRDALTQNRSPNSGDFGGGTFSALSLITSFTSQIGSARNSAEQTQSFAASRFGELTHQHLADGVDTDAELQRLLLVEQSFAANARVIQAVDEMLQDIMRI